jgi:hypothetical protein
MGSLQAEIPRPEDRPGFRFAFTPILVATVVATGFVYDRLQASMPSFVACKLLIYRHELLG